MDAGAELQAKLAARRAINNETITAPSEKNVKTWDVEKDFSSPQYGERIGQAKMAAQASEENVRARLEVEWTKLVDRAVAAGLRAPAPPLSFRRHGSDWTQWRKQFRTLEEARAVVEEAEESPVTRSPRRSPTSSSRLNEVQSAKQDHTQIMEKAKQQWTNEYTKALDSTKQKQLPASASDLVEDDLLQPASTPIESQAPSKKPGNSLFSDVQPQRRRVLTQPRVGEGEELQLLADLDAQIARICTEMEAEGGQQKQGAAGRLAVGAYFLEKQGAGQMPQVLGAELVKLDRQIGAFLATAAR